MHTQPARTQFTNAATLESKGQLSFMASADAGVITTLLRSSAAGDQAARHRLLEVLYPDLRRIARGHLRGEHFARTLDPTALVHETFLKLLAPGGPVSFSDRLHFYAIASRHMRRVLIDYARRRRTRRSFAASPGAEARATTIPPVELALLLDRLAILDSRAAEVVDLRFWGGLSQSDIARVLDVSVSTVQRDWDFARLWLISEYRGSGCNYRNSNG
jgi:RNA polymerase sigma factor (TIGR02999 family)